LRLIRVDPGRTTTKASLSLKPCSVTSRRIDAASVARASAGNRIRTTPGERTNYREIAVLVREKSHQMD